MPDKNYGSMDEATWGRIFEACCAGQRALRTADEKLQEAKAVLYEWRESA